MSVFGNNVNNNINPVQDGKSIVPLSANIKVRLSLKLQ